LVVWQIQVKNSLAYRIMSCQLLINKKDIYCFDRDKNQIGDKILVSILQTQAHNLSAAPTWDLKPKKDLCIMRLCVCVEERSTQPRYAIYSCSLTTSIGHVPQAHTTPKSITLVATRLPSACLKPFLPQHGAA
jgi:hypothetical protein